MSETVPTPFDIRLMNICAAALLTAFVVALLAALLSGAANHPVFAIGAVAVTGDVTHNNAVTLRANVLPKLSGSTLTIDLARAKQAFEAVPWVRQAVVRREFPNRIKVVLQEHRAVAFWGAEGDSKMLNNFGEVFEANVGEVENEALPRLSGPTGQEPQVLAMAGLLAPQFELLDLQLEQLELTGRGSWIARLDNGAAVELGRGSDADVVERTARFLRTLTQVTSRYKRRPDAVDSADLRHPDGYALRLRGVSTLAAAGQKN